MKPIAKTICGSNRAEHSSELTIRTYVFFSNTEKSQYVGRAVMQGNGCDVCYTRAFCVKAEFYHMFGHTLEP